MRKSHTHTIAFTVALAIAVSFALPRQVLGIKTFSPITEAEAQLLGGGGGQGIMQMLPQLMMLMMLMQMMGQKKGDSASGKVKDARDDALQNLQQAGKNPGSAPQVNPAPPAPLTSQPGGVFAPLR